MSGAADYTLAEYTLTVASTSVGASPVACMVTVPFDGELVETQLATATAITTTDSTVTVTVLPAGVVANSLTVGGTIVATVTGAGIGKNYSNMHTTNRFVSKGDTIRLTPAGGGGAGVIGVYTLRIRR